MLAHHQTRAPHSDGRQCLTGEPHPTPPFWSLVCQTSHGRNQRPPAYHWALELACTTLSKRKGWAWAPLLVSKATDYYFLTITQYWGKHEGKDTVASQQVGIKLICKGAMRRNQRKERHQGLSEPNWMAGRHIRRRHPDKTPKVTHLQHGWPWPQIASGAGRKRALMCCDALHGRFQLHRTKAHGKT